MVSVITSVPELLESTPVPEQERPSDAIQLPNALENRMLCPFPYDEIPVSEEKLILRPEESVIVPVKLHPFAEQVPGTVP